MSEVKLLPCPFCGGAATTIGFVSGKGLKKPKYVTGKETADCYFVKCSVCSCQTGVNYSKIGAINKWNNRKPIENIEQQLNVLADSEGKRADIYARENFSSMAEKYSHGESCYKNAAEIVRKGGENE